MNIHQFRFVQEAVRQGLNLTETAKVLFTSQPGVSKAILELEDELGIDIFARHGKRLRKVTEPGQEVLKSIEIIMREVNNLKRIGAEFSKQDCGTLSIATTHSQARYFLPEPLSQLLKRYPKVTFSLHQGAPLQVVQMLLDEVAEVGIATEAVSHHPELVSLPCYEWQHVAVMPSSHPLAQVERIRLEQLAVEPLITYHPSFSGRTRIDQTFASRHIQPHIVLEAIDADVIKTYVRLGMGIGLLSEMAIKHDDGASDLVARPLGHLFGKNVTRVAFKKGVYLRNFVYAFTESLSSRLTRQLINKAFKGDDEESDDYQL